eukprot:tig00000042_g15645.t1
MRLPDELVQRIFSELEATEAFEECRLWAVDRRFRQLVREVHWQQLRVESSVHVNAVQKERVRVHRQRLRRIAARVESGAMRGCKRLVVGTLDAGEFEDLAMTEMLSALSAAPAPLEHISFCCCLPSSFLKAFHSAPLQSLHLEGAACSEFVAAAVPGRLPYLRELYLGTKDRLVSLARALQSKLMHIWPGLKKLSCGVRDGAALRALAGLPLDELRVEVSPRPSNSFVFRVEVARGALDEAIESLNADCVRALHLPPRSEVLGPSGLAAIIRFRHIEELTVTVDHTSSGVLAGLGALQKLRSLSLWLDASAAPKGAAILLQAASDGVEASQRLESMTLRIYSTEESRRSRQPRVPLDPPSLASLVRVSRPYLDELSIEDGPPSFDVLSEIARPGPKLESVHLDYELPEPEDADSGVQEISALEGLLELSDDRHPDLEIRVDVSLAFCDAQTRENLSVLRNQLQLEGDNLPIAIEFSERDW